MARVRKLVPHLFTAAVVFLLIGESASAQTTSVKVFSWSDSQPNAYRVTLQELGWQGMPPVMVNVGPEYKFNMAQTSQTYGGPPPYPTYTMYNNSASITWVSGTFHRWKIQKQGFFGNWTTVSEGVSTWP